MEVNISFPLHLAWMLSVLITQTGIDIYFTREIINLSTGRRMLLLAVSGSTAMLVIVLFLRIFFSNFALILRRARDESPVFAVWFVGVLAFYVFLGFIFTLLKGFIVRYLGLDEASHEKQQEWWNYTFVANVVTILLASPSFFVSFLLPALLTSTPFEN